MATKRLIIKMALVHSFFNMGWTTHCL